MKLDTTPPATIDESLAAVEQALAGLQQFPPAQQVEGLRKVAELIDRQLTTPLDDVVDLIGIEIEDQLGELPARDFNAFVLRLRRRIHDQLENAVLAANAEG